MAKYLEILDFGVRFAARFHSRYPPTSRKYYKPPPTVHGVDVTTKVDVASTLDAAETIVFSVC